jgi:hypothetical protein
VVPRGALVAVLLFAYSTMLAWSYYGAKATAYLFKESRRADLGFKLVFCLFVVVGASTSLDPVIGFSDAMIFAMSIPNLIGLYLLAPVSSASSTPTEASSARARSLPSTRRPDSQLVILAGPEALPCRASVRDGRFAAGGFARRRGCGP